MVNKLEINDIFEEYLKMEERVKLLVWCLRFWSKNRQINHAFVGKINSFAWTTMSIAFCQQERVLPPLQTLIEKGIGCYSSKTQESNKGENNIEEQEEGKMRVDQERTHENIQSNQEKQVLGRKKNAGTLLIEFLEFLLYFDKQNKR